MFRHTIICLLLTLSSPVMTHAQELDARVTINHQQVQGTSTSVFETLKTALEQFLNERQWTNMQFKKNERIACNFAITIKNILLQTTRFKVHLMCKVLDLCMAQHTLPLAMLLTTLTLISPIKSMTK